MYLKNLILSGGGIKGIAFFGAYQYLYENDLLKNIKTLTGTSVGALISLFINLGFTPKELKNIFFKLPLTELTELDILHFFENYGLDNGSSFINSVSIMIKHKVNPNITFKELYEKSKITLNITGSCLTTLKLEIFNHEKTPDMHVLDAIRISTAVPLFFTPAIYKDKYYVDGGLFNNLPIDLFDHELENSIAISSMGITNGFVQSFEDYLNIIVFASFRKNQNKKIKKYKNNIIVLDNIPEKYTLAFNVDLSFKMNIFNIGYNCTQQYFEKREQKEDKEYIHQFVSEIINKLIQTNDKPDFQKKEKKRRNSI